MFQVGDYVVYNEEGVCRVESIGPLDIRTADKSIPYYHLRPLAGEGKVYVPVDTQLPMRPMLTKAEAQALIASIPKIDSDVNRLGSRRLLEEHYRGLMRPHTPEAMVRTIKSAYEKRKDGEKPRVLSSTDEYYKKRAEAMLYQELGLALEIPADQVEQYICDALGWEQKQEQDQ